MNDIIKGLDSVIRSSIDILFYYENRPADEDIISRAQNNLGKALDLKIKIKRDQNAKNTL